MGGSGGNDTVSSGGSFFTPGGGEAECGSFEFDAPLMSPIPAVASVTLVGTDCEILMEGAPPQLVVYIRRTGEQLGAITEQMMFLLRCIDRGFQYEAQVTMTAPIRLHVRPRRRYQMRLPFTTTLSEVSPGVTFAVGDTYALRLDSSDRVIVSETISVLGRVKAEPVALPDAVRTGHAKWGTVVNPVVPTIEISG